MNQSEINTAIDLSYGRITAIAQVVKKENKGHVYRAQQSLYKAMEESKLMVSPAELPKTPVAKEGKPVEIEKAIRNTKTVIENLAVCKAGIPVTEKDLIKGIEDTIEALTASIPVEEEKKEEVTETSPVAEEPVVDTPETPVTDVDAKKETSAPESETPAVTAVN